MLGQFLSPPGCRRPGPGAGAEPDESGGAVLDESESESGGAVLDEPESDEPVSGGAFDELDVLDESDELDVEPSDWAHAAAPDPSTSPANVAATHMRFKWGAMSLTSLPAPRRQEDRDPPTLERPVSQRRMSTTQATSRTNASSSYCAKNDDSTSTAWANDSAANSTGW